MKVSQLKQQFDEQGFAIMRQALSPSVVAAAQAELEAMVDDIACGLLAMDHVQKLYENEPFEKRLATLFSFARQLAPKSMRHNLHRRGMYGLFFCPGLLDVVEEILGPEIRLYPNYTVRPKFPDDVKTQVLWHQDAGYTEGQTKTPSRTDQLTVNDLRMINIWTAFVPARAENGCMQFIPGTHKLGVIPHESREHYLEIVESELKPRLKAAVDITTDPGDVVLFNNLLFHQGQPNRSGTIRWSCDWRYQDATQPTLRRENGHLARSGMNPDRVVRSADQWASLHFC